MTEPEVVEVNEIMTAVVHRVVAMTEIVDFFDRSFSELASVLERQGIAPSGPSFARYAGPPGATVDIEVGFPVGAAVERDGQVHRSWLPGGPVARLVHVGGYEQLGDTWSRLGSWIAEQGLSPGADLWEVYVTEPSPDMDPDDLRTELFWSVRSSAAGG